MSSVKTEKVIIFNPSTIIKLCNELICKFEREKRRDIDALIKEYMKPKGFFFKKTPTIEEALEKMHTQPEVGGCEALSPIDKVILKWENKIVRVNRVLRMSYIANINDSNLYLQESDCSSINYDIYQDKLHKKVDFLAI